MIGQLDRQATDSDIVSFVDRIRREPSRRAELAALLDERHPVYGGRGANEVTQIRGFVMAAFEGVGLPEDVLPHVLEELETGRSALSVAAAAAALRGSAPHHHYERHLRQALENVRYTDDAVAPAVLKPSWPIQHHTTATEQLQQTLQWLREAATANAAAADPEESTTTSTCCHPGSDPNTAASELTERPPAPLDVSLQDQVGRVISLGDLLDAPLTVLVFFYTRCDNPNKCSRSIGGLAQLQQRVRSFGLHESVQTAAVTYDPAYDDPDRLLAYGVNRGYSFDDRNRFLRAPTDMDRLRDYFRLGVSYGPVLPNRHPIELFIVNRWGTVVANHLRLPWDPEVIVGRLQELMAD